MSVSDDPDLREIIESAEAGVADVIAVYEQAEARYFAAVNQLSPQEPTVTYATHT